MSFRENWGSILSLAGGPLFFISGMGQTFNKTENSEGVLIGIVMIIGALIYRSAKFSVAGKKYNIFIYLYEAIGILIIFFSVFGQNDFKNLLRVYPFSNFVVPLWAFIAYAYAVYRRASGGGRHPEPSSEQ